eukprot:Plantae.Rhodophyta-Rhodochaete_pulchella.ctg2044.p1 GENE.Plantae.Rhodophyta-Rhodochaete_pulchella.ctg2044~~Plantae.Rhodophyta-Rhodochaete_pulchella.ctg2044.p1  ORF type:complete len:403 (-),score=61.66 Plantae.Rhodophyta-Rhodochaete_pulchella.ctg2044:84-1292(-)
MNTETRGGHSAHQRHRHEVPGLGLRVAEDASFGEPDGELKPVDEKRLLRSSRRFGSMRIGGDSRSDLDEAQASDLAAELTRKLSFNLEWNDVTQSWMLADTSTNSSAEKPFDPRSDPPMHYSIMDSQRLAMKMSQPPIFMTPYGRYWASDAVCLPHNALRRELMDAYVIFYSMEVRVSVLDQDDINMFYMWWDVFKAFVTHLLEAEEAVLYPWVEAKVKLDGALAFEGRKCTRDTMMTIVEIMDRAHLSFHGTNAGDGVGLLKLALDKLVLCLNDYMKRKEKKLVKIIDSQYGEIDKRQFEKSFVRFFLHGSSPGTDVPILSRWMKSQENPNLVAEWRYDNLGPSLSATHWVKETRYRRHIEIAVYFSSKRREFMARTYIVGPVGMSTSFGSPPASPRSSSY